MVIVGAGLVAAVAFGGIVYLKGYKGGHLPFLDQLRGGSGSGSSGSTGGDYVLMDQAGSP